MTAMIDLTGQTFGKWRVTGERHSTYYGIKWECVCECGNTDNILGGNLRHGKSMQCKDCRNANFANSKYGMNEGKDLYMVRCGPYVKIGTSSDVHRRLRKMQPDNPHPLELVGHWPGEGHREQHWHNELKHLHERGEWYRLGGY